MAFPYHVASSLATKVLERIWVPPIGCTPSLCQFLGCSGHYSQFHCPLSHAQWVSLQVWMVCPGPLLRLWEFGQLGVLLPLWPLPWPLSQGLLGVLEGLLPCLALVRAAMSLAICCPNCAIPSP